MRIPKKAEKPIQQMQLFMKEQGIVLTKEQTFRKLIEYEMLDRFGNPTQFALDNGLVELVQNE